MIFRQQLPPPHARCALSPICASAAPCRFTARRASALAAFAPLMFAGSVLCRRCRTRCGFTILVATISPPPCFERLYAPMFRQTRLRLPAPLPPSSAADAAAADFFAAAIIGTISPTPPSLPPPYHYATPHYRCRAVRFPSDF